MLGRRISFTSVLAATMAASTFMLLVFAVFADELMAELRIERWQVGLLVSAACGLSAVASPVVGRSTDRIGARRSTVLTLVVAAVGLTLVAAAPTYALLLLAALVTGVAQAMANPATNKLIALHVAAGRRGVVTGLKQSGVQVGVFVGGAALPALALAFGWRLAVVVFVTVFLACTALARATLPADDEADEHAARGARTRGGGGDGRLRGDVEPTASPTSRRVAVDRPRAGTTPVTSPTPLPRLVRRVAVYGLLFGAAGSAMFTFLPLYAEESLGSSDQQAGWAVALMGLVGIVARIGWGRVAELRLGTVRSLQAIAVLAVTAALLLLAAGAGAPELLWPAAIVTGTSASAWNSVGMLAIIQALPASETGRASGFVMIGFLAGLAVATPAFGWSVDATGSYVLGWSAAATMFALGLVVLAGVRSPAPAGAEVAGTEAR